MDGAQLRGEGALCRSLVAASPISLEAGSSGTHWAFLEILFIQLQRSGVAEDLLWVLGPTSGPFHQVLV